MTAPYDNPPPASLHGREPSSQAAPRSPNSGSAKRQRNHTTGTRWNDAEYAALIERAQETGLSRDAFIRACALGTPGPRARRAPHVNAVELAKATAALNKVGSNLNQIAHVLNASGSLASHECFAALAEIRAAAAAIRQTVGRKDRG